MKETSKLTTNSIKRRLCSDLMHAASLVSNIHLTRHQPLSLVHFVTRRCNARCSFCFIDFDNPPTVTAELTMAEIDHFTQTIGPNLCNVNITGGEPFLRADLIDIARSYLRNTRVQSIFITSNGSFPELTEQFAKAITAEFPARKLIISLSIDAPPEMHDRIRKVEGLFEKVLDTYNRLLSVHNFVIPNIAITVSHENYDVVLELYEYLTETRGIRAITASIVRDEGVYTVPPDQRDSVFIAYKQLTSNLVRDINLGRLAGYNPATLQGRLMNKKNEILYDIMSEIYLDPHFVSRCYAGSLFGVIDVDGTVYPCEILDKPLGNLREHEMDFSALWRSTTARKMRKWIKNTKCNCSYECAWAFNILANVRYQPKLIVAALKS